jgi:hypothetical protein
MKTLAFVMFTLLLTARTFETYLLQDKKEVFTGNASVAQVASDPLAATMSAHRNELILLARFYSFDLTRQDWIHEQVGICPAFSQHLFVRYHETGKPNADFLAIYPRSRGSVYIVGRGSGYGQSSPFPSERMATIAAFNAVWSDERGGRMVIPDLDWNDLAKCYAEIAGERLANRSTPRPDNSAKPVQIDIDHDRILRVGVEVVGNASATADLLLEFDKHGFVAQVVRSESNEPVHVR